VLTSPTGGTPQISTGMHRISFASKIFRTLSNEKNFERGHEEFDNQNTIPYTLEYKIIIFPACHLKKNLSCADGRTQGAGAPATYAARLSAQSARSTSPKGQLPVARNQGLD